MLVPPASYVYIHIVSYPAAFLHTENPMNPNVCWQIFWNFPASNLWISRWPPRDRPMTHGDPWLRRPTSCWIPPPMMASIWSPSTFMQRIHRRIHFSLLNWPGFGFVNEIYFRMKKPKKYGWFTFGCFMEVSHAMFLPCFLVPKPSEPWKLPLSIPWYWFVSRYAHNGLVHNHQISINKPVSITPNNFTHGSTVTVKW